MAEIISVEGLSGNAFASSNNSTNTANMAFDGNNSTYWQPTEYTTSTFSIVGVSYIGFKFNEKIKATSINITHRGTSYAVSSIKLQGSNDGSNWSDIGVYSVTDGVNINVNSSGYYNQYRVVANSDTAINYRWSINELVIKGVRSSQKALFSSGGSYKKYNTTTSSWQTITTVAPTEADYLNGNTLEEISAIPESAWQQLTGTVELLLYTDDTTKSEAEFEITTSPFTLAQELEGKEPTIVYYTDDTSKQSVEVTIETEPFTFYDEMGESFDVLYYTDDPAKTSAELEINANYTPLDEISEDFEVVTWTNQPIEEVSETVTSSFKETSTDGDLYSATVDLSKGVKSIK